MTCCHCCVVLAMGECYFYFQMIAATSHLYMWLTCYVSLTLFDQLWIYASTNQIIVNWIAMVFQIFDVQHGVRSATSEPEHVTPPNVHPNTRHEQETWWKTKNEWKSYGKESITKPRSLWKKTRMKMITPGKGPLKKVLLFFHVFPPFRTQTIRDTWDVHGKLGVRFKAPT